MYLSFDSFDDMIDCLAAAEQRANEAAKPWQLDLAGGDLVILTDPQFEVEIIGELIDLPSEPDSPAHVNAGNPRKWGRWYSELCPEGEQGTNHCALIERRLSQAEFDEFLAGLQ